MDLFNMWEFRNVLYQMHSDKSLTNLHQHVHEKFPHHKGPKLYGEGIFHASVTWLDQGYFTPQLNNIDIVLFPKKDNPSTMKDFWPIALCNVLYKIISKVFVNRLRPFLAKCISLEQPLFGESKSILDNVLVFIETIHYMQCKRLDKFGEFALKIDINKAFDKIDWIYLQSLLDKLGFHNKWILDEDVFYFSRF